MQYTTYSAAEEHQNPRRCVKLSSQVCLGWCKPDPRGGGDYSIHGGLLLRRWELPLSMS